MTKKTKPITRTTSKAEQDAYEAADEFKRLVAKRTGLTPQQLVCPREKSDMTPCLARDGHLVVVFTSANPDRPICVGCETDLMARLEEEKKKHGDNSDNRSQSPSIP